MHELPPTGVRGRVGISFKLGVIVLLRLPLFHRHMRLFVYYLGLFVYYLGFRSLSLFLITYYWVLVSCRVGELIRIFFLTDSPNQIQIIEGLSSPL